MNISAYTFQRAQQQTDIQKERKKPSQTINKKTQARRDNRADPRALAGLPTEQELYDKAKKVTFMPEQDKDYILIVFGGFTNRKTVVNDTWMSTDGGVNWIPSNTACSWRPRELFRSVVFTNCDGKQEMLICGGRESGGAQLDDIWTGTDTGTHWSRPQ